MTSALAVIFLSLSGAGCLYLIYAACVCVGFTSEAAQESPHWPPVTLLKPLRGDEPALSRNLASFWTQDYPAPVQLVFGVQAADDAAIDVVERLKANHPDRDTRLVIEAATHGANLKISNLINMTPAAKHDRLVLSDSDIAAPKDYLRRVVAALDEPGVGAVTCLYHGVPGAGLWSRLSALAIDSHFLPNVLVGLRLGMATPCFGSTIALRRGCLNAIGGFAAFSNLLADDYAIGAAVRDKGLRVAIPRFLVGHTCNETSLTELWRHELRWARTIRTVDLWGHAGSVVTHPLAFAILASLAGAPIGGALFACLAIVGRMAILRLTARNHRLETLPYGLVPLRDLLSFAVFAWSFFGQDLSWRGDRYRVRSNGVLISDRRTKAS